MKKNVKTMLTTENSIINRIKTLCGIEIRSLRLLAENNYCLIYLGDTARKPLIIKKYKTADNELARLEAAGVATYHLIVAGDEGFIDSQPLFCDDEMKLVGISFVEGKCLADYLYQQSQVSTSWPELCEIVEKLGIFLRKARECSQKPGQNFTPFHRDYLSYCSKKLRRLRLVGSFFFADIEKDVSRLSDALNPANADPSFAHGDFVFRNIHVHERRPGLIDFANCLEASHQLNDVFNLWFALQNMIISGELKSRLWESFLRGLGQADFSEPVLHFFFEYHRRRWLMLNLGSKDPRRWMRAFYGMKTFAREFPMARAQFRL